MSVYVCVYVMSLNVCVLAGPMRPLSVQTHYRTPVPEESLSPRTRQQRDIDNALRHMKLVCVQCAFASVTWQTLSFGKLDMCYL